MTAAAQKGHNQFGALPRKCFRKAWLMVGVIALLPFLACITAARKNAGAKSKGFYRVRVAGSRKVGGVKARCSNRNECPQERAPCGMNRSCTFFAGLPCRRPATHQAPGTAIRRSSLATHH